MASAVKRVHDDSVSSGVGSGLDTNGPPPLKKKHNSQPQRIGPVSTNEELDIEVLRFQHKKLKQRVEQRQRNEAALLERIEQLEKRQTQDDAVLNVINRYWNQLNEDIRILNQRFDAETSDESESKNESEPTTSFLTQLSTWDKDELDEKLANRVQVSTRAVAKIIQAFDRLQQRSTKITDALESNSEYDVNDVIKETNIQLERENKKLQALNTSLHEKNHVMSLKMKEMSDKFNSEETKADELKNQVDDLNWELTKLVESNDKLASQVQELQDKNKRLQQLCGSVDKKDVELNDRKLGVTDMEIINLQKENEECKELAVNRLIELEKLNQTHREVLKELEQYKMDIKNLPEHVIVQTVEYTTLQSKFSVVYNDCLLLRQTLDETKSSLRALSSTHLKAIEQMESEELLGQKKLRTEVMQLEDMLSQLRKEYEMLRIEFEQNLAANEQTGPINREMRHLITSLQNHNQQLKGDAQRYRRKYKECLSDFNGFKRKHAELEMKFHTRSHDVLNNDSGLDGFKDEDDSPSSSMKTEPVSPSDSTRNHEAESSNDVYADSPPKLQTSSPHALPLGVDMSTGNRTNDIKKEFSILNRKVVDESNIIIRKLRHELKQSSLIQKETKLLLDMYKGMGKEQRDKAQLMASEKKYRTECEELRQHLKRLQESQREEKKKLADEEALTKIKLLEDQVHSLQKQVAAQKSEEETLITEMEVTGQAFEDMQEQNSRLIQQLREKDNANFKLMSDRIKSTQLHNLAREELQQQNEKIKTLTNQVEAQNQVVRKLEEKERVLLNNLQQTDIEGLKRLQSCELSKRKAIESAQSAADLKLHLEKYHSQMKEAQQTVAEKTSALEAESFKTKRLQEELTMLRRRVERLNKIEMAGNTDEVLQEEIREYKEILTCPSCKVKKKDAVLNKCFHVFCFDCLRTRYETRQRKCPKCNAAFGANDYHRLYLT